MENSILVAVSAQDVLRRNLDVIANNIANLDTAGFKAERFMVTAFPVAAARPRTEVPGTTAFVRDLATVRDASDGRLSETGNALDVALRGDGYFTVSTPDGDRYTRDGHFRLDDGGRLVNEDGFPVQGLGGGPLVFAPEDASIEITGDGTISSDRGEIGKLRVVRFDDPSTMQAAGDGLATSEQTPQEVTEPQVLQGMIEKSNVEPILEMERMIRVQRAYDQAKQLVDREDERIRKMITVFVE
ncbi:MAG: flagellar basal-body rod protein FlgF [Rhodospirillales bacterium]